MNMFYIPHKPSWREFDGRIRKVTQGKYFVNFPDDNSWNADIRCHQSNGETKKIIGLVGPYWSDFHFYFTSDNIAFDSNEVEVIKKILDEIHGFIKAWNQPN